MFQIDSNSMQLDQLIGKSAVANNRMTRSLARIKSNGVQACIAFRFYRLVLMGIKNCQGFDNTQTDITVEINCVHGVFGACITTYIEKIENIDRCDDLVLVKVSASTEMKDLKLHPLNHIFY